MKKIVLAALISALWCAPALAIVAKLPHKANDAPVFACMPKDFTLVKDDKGLHLHGTLEVSADGYVSYAVEEEEPGPDGSLHGTLHVTAPQGKDSTPSKIEINYTFKGEGDRMSLSIDGPGTSAGKIECKVAESAQ
jgi:hypothetical protein